VTPSKISSHAPRRALLCGTALGVSLLIVGAPALALAAPDDVVINQPTASSTLDNAPAVQASTGGSATVTVETITTTGRNAYGVELSAAGEVIVDVGSVTTQGHSSHGIEVIAGAGPVTIEADTVRTNGNNAVGIYVEAGGDVTIDVGTVETQGGFAGGLPYEGPATAILVRTSSGTARITADSISTNGIGSHGVHFDSEAYGDAGAIIDVGTINTVTRDTFGINLNARGDSSIKVGNVTTTAFEGHGVYARMLDDADLVLDIGSVTTGAAVGVWATSEAGNISGRAGTVRSGNSGVLLNTVSGDINFQVDDVATTSSQSGVGASSESGDIVLTVTQARTDGALAGAITVANISGDITVNAGTILSNGRDSVGISAQNETGAITLTSTSITSGGARSTAIEVTTNVGAVDVTSGDITTSGVAGRAIDVVVYGPAGEQTGPQTVKVTSGSITTTGENAGAITVEGLDGKVTVDSGTISTTGVGAWAIMASTNQGDIEIDSDSISTEGEVASGIDARSVDGNIDIDSGEITLTGEAAIAINARSETGDILIASTSIITSSDTFEGDDIAAAIESVTDSGDISVVSGSIATEGRAMGGMWLASAEGDITARSTSITTLGDSALGLLVQTVDGDIDVDSEEVVTEGADATGIRLETETGAVTLISDSVTTSGDDALGISILAIGYPEEGDTRPISVTSGSVTTSGENAIGIEVKSQGRDIVVDSGSVQTTGVNAQGLWVQADNGDMDVTSDSVTTTGAFATGIELHSTVGDIKLTSGSVSTTGDGAHGIGAYSTQGSVSIDSTSVTSTGGVGEGRVRAAAIWGQGRTGVSITSGTVVADGANRHGVMATSSAGPVTLQIGSVDVNGEGGRAVWATAAGNVTATFTGAIDADLAQTIDLVSTSGAVSATIGANASVFGGTGAVRVESGAAGSTIRNNGSIQTDSGYAIDAVGGAATVHNAGQLRGLVRLTANGDSVFNTGTWTTTGVSEFGAGTDLLDNNGLIELAVGAAVQTITFTDLERIANRGRIDLANGLAGDRLVATGAVLDGQGTGVIDLDVDFATGVADQLIIASATGVTRIDINALGTVALGQSFDLIDSTAALSGSEFVLTPGSEETLVGYDLVYEAEGLVRLASAPNVNAFAPLKTAAAGQRAWTKTAEVWSTRMSQIRDIEALGGREDKIQFWTQAYGGQEEFGQKQVYDLAGGPVTRDLTTEAQFFGVQAGVDGVISTEPASFAWGLTGGYGDVRLDFVSHDNLITLKGFNVGAYGGVSAGTFYANALIKLDSFSAEAELREAAASADYDGRAYGVQAEAGARFAVGDWTVEPQAGVAWVKVDLDGFDVAGAEIGFDDAVSLEGRLGVRVSTTTTVGGLKLRTFAGGYAVKEFEGENEMTFAAAGGDVLLKDKPADAYGRIELGATTQVAPGVHGFIRGEANVGDNASGFTGRFGASWSW